MWAQSGVRCTPEQPLRIGCQIQAKHSVAAQLSGLLEEMQSSPAASAFACKGSAGSPFSVCRDASHLSVIACCALCQDGTWRATLPCQVPLQLIFHLLHMAVCWSAILHRPHVWGGACLKELIAGQPWAGQALTCGAHGPCRQGTAHVAAGVGVVAHCEGVKGALQRTAAGQRSRWVHIQHRAM